MTKIIKLHAFCLICIILILLSFNNIIYLLMDNMFPYACFELYVLERVDTVLANRLFLFLSLLKITNLSIFYKYTSQFCFIVYYNL